MVSVGRRPRTEGLVAPGSAVRIDERGFVVADEYQRTAEAGVWAVGDVVAGTPQLAHVGFAEAIVAVKSMLGEPVSPVDHAKVPWAIYCHPEVAFCGLTEAQAKAKGIDVVTKKDPFGGNSRAIIVGDTEGVVKIVAERGPTDRLGGFSGSTSPAPGSPNNSARGTWRSTGRPCPKKWRISSSRTRHCRRTSARRCWL